MFCSEKPASTKPVLYTMLNFNRDCSVAPWLPFTISSTYIEDIYFFEVNTKYISSSELKTSKFLRVRSTSENLDVFKSLDEIYLVFTDKK